MTGGVTENFNAIDTITLPTVIDEIWIQPSGWTGPDATLYRSFDSSDGLVLIEGSVQMSFLPLVSVKVH